MATRRQGSLRGPGLLLAVAVVAGLLAACTPRTAYASLDNRAGTDVVVLNSWHETAGRVAAGETDHVEVGQAGDCVERLLVLTADLRRIAVVDGPVCEHDDIAVEAADLVPAASLTLRNGTGLALGEGVVGAVPVDALADGEERLVPLAVAEDGCTDVRVRFVTRDAAGSVVAEARTESGTLVCDGGTLVVEPWMASRIVADERVPVAPSPSVAAVATVTFTNGSADILQLVVDGDWQDAVAPGEVTVAEFAASAAGCATVPVRALIGPAGTEVPPFTGTLCDGAHYVVGVQGFDVVTQGGTDVRPEP